MSQSKFPARIRYEYEQDPAARLQYAHGVWGGINPQGEIEIDVYKRQGHALHARIRARRRFS